MRKLLTFILAAALVICLGAASAFAAPSRNSCPAAADRPCPSGHMDCTFTDADGDGICDKQADCGNRQSAGICGKQPNCENRQRSSFTDADGDGVCDNRVGREAHHGSGHGHGHHGGRWG